MTARLGRVIDRILALGADPADDEDVALHKRGLVVTMLGIVVLAPIWVIVYLALGRPLSATIPFLYVLVTSATLLRLSRDGWATWIRSSQIALILVLPALLQWSLGGFVHGSAVIIWAFTAVAGALVFSTLRQATIVLGLFIALVFASGILDARLMAVSEPLPDAVIRTFFVLNIAAVSVLSFISIIAFIHQRDRARAATSVAMVALDSERARSDALLRRVLPDAVAARLKDDQEVADRYDAVTVLFADIVGFAPLATGLAPDALVRMLDHLFSDMDTIASRQGLVRIKTIGDAWMAAAGVPDPVPAGDGALAAATTAFGILDAVARDHPELRVRIGIHTGPAVAAVIGTHTLAYDIWGDAVNVASRMESHGVPDAVQVSAATRELVVSRFGATHRGTIEVKGLGRMDTYLLERSTA